MSVFGRFFTHDIDNIVVCDDPKHFVLVVDHGNRQQVHPCDFIRDFFLIFEHINRDDLCFHHLRNQSFRFFHSYQELSGRNKPAQTIFFIDDIEVIDGFVFFGLPANFVKGFTNRKMLFEFGNVGCHHRTGGVFGVLTKPLEVSSFLDRK